jgi:hypothetical protein
VPLQVVDSTNVSPAGILAGGTGALIETPARRFILTAAHVVRALGGNRVTALLSGGGGSNPVDISAWRQIAIDDDLDIGTIAIPPEFDPTPLGKTFYAPKPAWALANAVRGDVAFFVGFPGLHRQVFTAAVVNNASPFCDFVSSASERQFVMADEKGERVVARYREHLAKFGPTGGISGAPVFVPRGRRLTLAGVLKEGGEGHATTFFAAHARFVMADGQVQR